MDARYMTNEAEIEAFREASKRVSEVSAALSAAVVALVPFAEPGSPAETALRKIEAVEEQIRGMSYHDLTPQSEWMGGPRETATYKYRWPHGLVDVARMYAAKTSGCCGRMVARGPQERCSDCPLPRSA